MTSALASRWIDTFPGEPTLFLMTPTEFTPRIEVLPAPAEPLGHEVFEVTEDGIRTLRFRDGVVRVFPHASYGLTLRSPTMEIPLREKAPRPRMRMKYKHRPLVQWVPSPSSEIPFQPEEAASSNPGERFD
jgi:hypothetical protein